MAQTLYQGEINTGQLYREYREGSGLGIIVGVILAAIVAIMLLAYALPALQNVRNNRSVTTPERMNVKLNQTPALLQ